MTPSSPLKVSTAQFEHRSGDKAYNLSVIDRLAGEAAAAGSQVVTFHECCISGYTFARHLSREAMMELAEEVPAGPSIQSLISIAGKHGVHLLAGLFERDGAGGLHKAYVCVNGSGLVAKFRKLHPFIHADLQPGTEYVLFDIHGWTCSILICYDNNIPENARAVRLMGAQILFMPHVTMCTPSTRPGSGFVDPKLWEQRHIDPDTLRAEFDGPKGRQWLMKWLPARAWDNALYCIFANAIGMDDDQLKNGCSMIVDPHADILAECRSLGDEVVTAELHPGKLSEAGGARYTAARRPSLYRDIIGAPHEPVQKVAWKDS